MLIPTFTLQLHTVLTCPVCAHQQAEVMPTNACQYFYDCPNCRAVLRPLPGDCCVFCSYATVPCPPMQGPGGCCARA